MFDVNQYIERLEETLGISIPPNAAQEAVYHLVYDTMAANLELSDELKLQMDFTPMEPETNNMLQGEERSGFAYIAPIAIDTQKAVFKRFKNVSYGTSAEDVYTIFSEYTLKVLACKSDARSIWNIVIESGIVAAGTVAAVATIVASGGAATPAIIAGICSGISVLTGFFATFNERSFTGLVLNDSNKDAELNYKVGDIYSDCGKFVAVPGDAESKRAYIPKKQNDFAFLGLYKVHNNDWFCGAGGVLRFKFANSSPKDIDLMMLSPYSRGNVTGITIGDVQQHVSKQFRWMRDADVNTMDLNKDGVKGRATLVNMRGSDAQGIAWFEFTK